MLHPFQDKLFVFIGTPQRCTRQAARDALTAVGGVTDERLTTFTNYVVACNRAEGTQIYRKALKYERDGLLVVLNEVQFFDILEGRVGLPKNQERGSNVIAFPGKDPEAEAREEERVRQNILNRKRLNSLAKHGVPTPDGGRVKADLRPLDMARRIAELMKDGGGQIIRGTESLTDRCDKCGNPARVYFGDGHGGEVANLCLDCYNRMMADMSGTDMGDIPPKRLSFKSRGEKTHEFEIELMMFTNGKSLTATEIGKSKRKADVYGELDDDIDDMLETLKKRIKKALSVIYMQPDGYVVTDKAVGYIEYNHERDACDIIIDGKPYTWAELEKNISAHEGWGIKIEFGDVGEELDI